MMTKRRRYWVLGAAVLVIGGCVALMLIDTREMGRTDPKTAAALSPPKFLLSQTYSTGSVLGIQVGQGKIAAIESAERAGFEIMPSAWGDSHAGGADLYVREDLLAKALNLQEVPMVHGTNIKPLISLHFTNDRLTAIDVTYAHFSL